MYPPSTSNNPENPPRINIQATSGATSVCEPCLYEKIVQHWETLCTPLDCGAFGYWMSYLATPAVTVYWEHFDTAVRLRGLSPPHRLVFSVPIRLGARSAYMRKPWSGDGFPATMPSGYDLVIDRGQFHLVVLIDLSTIRSALPEDVVAHLERAAHAYLLPAGAETIEAFGAWLLGLLDQVQRHPELLRHPATVWAIEQDLIHRLAGSIQIPVVSKPKAFARRRMLNRALEYLRAAEFSMLSVPEWCKAAGASQRTLEYAFREYFEMTPLAFLRLRRLHEARRRLLTFCRNDASVADIAHEQGFYELGRFASDYRQLFGELPSQTLRRHTPESTRLAPEIDVRLYPTPLSKSP